MKTKPSLFLKVSFGAYLLIITAIIIYEFYLTYKTESSNVNYFWYASIDLMAIILTLLLFSWLIVSTILSGGKIQTLNSPPIL